MLCPDFIPTEQIYFVNERRVIVIIRLLFNIKILPVFFLLYIHKIFLDIFEKCIGSITDQWNRLVVRPRRALSTFHPERRITCFTKIRWYYTFFFFALFFYQTDSEIDSFQNNFTLCWPIPPDKNYFYFTVLHSDYVKYRVQYFIIKIRTRLKANGLRPFVKSSNKNILKVHFQVSNTKRFLSFRAYPKNTWQNTLIVSCALI